MYAVLGSIEFDLITYFDGLEAQFATNYAEHALIGRKPRLQFVGDALDEVKIDLIFHISYCNPENELIRLKDALSRHDVLALVLGNGDYKGRFVITELSAVSRHTDTFGGLLAVEAKMSLREFAGDPGQPTPPAIRPAGTPLAVPVRNTLVASRTVSGFAKAISSVKSVMATTAKTISAIQGLRSLAKTDPLTALGRLPGAMLSVGKVLPALGVSAETMQGFETSLKVATDAGKVARSISSIRTEMSGLSGLAHGAAVGNVFAKLSSMETLAERAALELGNIQKPLARLAAQAATRQL